MSPFHYRLAISYLEKPDGLIASEIERRLGAVGISTFVARSRQPELLGTQAVERFANVFRSDAEQVLVLYRAGWGETSWTAVERDAIHDRRVADGIEFLKLVIMDGSDAPDWFPRSRIWGRFDALGVAGVAESCIAGRAAPRPAALTPPVARPSEALKLAASLDADARRRAFLDSAAGVQAADEEAERLLQLIAALAKGCGAIFERTETRHYPACSVYRDGYAVTVAWANRHLNTLDHAKLIIVEWKGRPAIGSTQYSSAASDLRHTNWRFDVDANGTRGWNPPNTVDGVASSERTADHIMTLLLNRIRGTVGQ